MCACKARASFMKILLLRFSSIGDIVLTTPVARCLKQQLGAEVHFLTKQAFAPILQANPHVDRVFSFKKEIGEVLRGLQSEQYDWVIDLHHNLRTLRLKLSLGRPARSFNKLNFEKWLLVNTGLDLLPDRHIVQRYMATVRHLGVQYDGKGLDFFIPAAEEVDLPALSPALSTGNFVAIVIGATHATKRLPAEKIAAIARLLDRQVVLIGGPAESEAGHLISRLAGPQVVNTCGHLSLMQSASVVRQAAKVITHDTGLMHVAAAFGKEIVSIWGSTVPKFGMAPFFADGVGHNTTMEITGLRCRPCSKIGFDRCPKGHFRCMNDQHPEEIAEAANHSSVASK